MSGRGAAPPRSNPRAVKLKKLFDGVLSGKQELSPATGPLFLEAICQQPDPAACVNKLIASKPGLPALQSAMRMDLSIAFANGLATTVLTYLQAPDLQAIGNGVFIHKIVTAIADPPIFWDSFCLAFQDRQLQENAQQAFAWLLLQLISLPSDLATGFRNLVQDDAILTQLSASPRPETKALAEKIRSIMITFNAAEPLDDEDEENRPGGRHNNDFVDFRDIIILPTAEEMQYTARPFLRTSDMLEDPFTFDNRVALYLDHLFRLGREDMLYDLREELNLTLGKKKGKGRGFYIDGMQPTGVFCGKGDRRKVKWGLTFELKNDLPQLKGKEKVQDRSKVLIGDKKILRHQALSCLLVDDEAVAFPTVHREEDLLAKKPPVVVLQFDGEASIVRMLQRLRTGSRISLVQIDTAIFAYEPVLKALQKMTKIPLADELLFWDEEDVPITPSTMPMSIVDQLRTNPYQDLRPILQIQQSRPICLDKSQVASMRASLTQRVSLIQGPPGTGKSFIGALLAKALHDSSHEIILVVCYTNHALDQFLEDLLKIGIPSSSIVRIGSKANAQMEPMTLYRQTNNYKQSRTDWQEIDGYRATANYLSGELDRSVMEYLNSNMAPEDLLEHLEFDATEYFRALQVPDAEDGMTQVGKGGRDVDRYYLLRQWLAGKDAGIYSDAPNVLEAPQVWGMEIARRVELADGWTSNIMKEKVDAIWSMGRDYNEATVNLDRMFNQHVGHTLRSKRIIGCTTTAAAKYSEEIASAKPGILLVEEAGEILESHVVTALSANTKQLILIGDHKQLRPKVNNYGLTVEKGDGYDMNVSLFERLILKGYPHETLSQQHRMRPEISALVRELTYPDLVDADSTKNRPNVRGLQDNIIFLNHTHLEDDLRGVADRRDKTTTSSKQNSYESDMVLKIVRYLGQQGYGTDKLVILTPYLGQLSLLRKKLLSETDPVLNDLDSYDLVRAGLLPAGTAKLMKKPIKLATIDNYQGEESEIVIASLTRSNPNNDIGFMFSPERLNVLLSRARIGLILIGNANTFMNSRKGGELWRQLFSLLKQYKRVYDGLPVRCERHPARSALLKQPHDFDDLVPDGGCLEPCGVMLSCGLHTCPWKCHQLADHSKMRCDTISKDSCPKGHTLSWTCHDGRPVVCTKCEREKKAAEDKQRKAFEAQKKREDDERAHAAKMAKLDEELQEARQKLRDEALDEERANSIRQKAKDIEEARAQAARYKSVLQTRGPDPETSNVLSQQYQSSTSTLIIPLVNSEQSIKKPTSAPSSTVKQTETKATPAPASASEQQYRKAAPAPSRKTATQSQNSSPPTQKTATSPKILQPPPVSEAEKEWDRQKTMDGESNEAIDAIMSMTGLEGVKSQVLKIKTKLDTLKRQNASLKGERFNIVLLGNPGTGKTTVARHYAKFLASVQVLPSANFIETTGSRLGDEGVSGAKKMVEGVIQTGGGTIFIDEAYQLKSDGASQGGPVLDFLLAEMENNVDKLVFILAGYSKQMEKFFDHNPGLPSRVPYKLYFADYEDAELLLMLQRMVRMKYNGWMEVEDGDAGLYMRIAVRRLGRGRGTEGFGNARALENMLAKVAERQAERLAKERREGRRPNDFILTKVDLIGPEPSKAVTESKAWKKLQEMIGLRSLKESVRNFFDLVETNYRRDLLELQPLQMSLNRIFLGSPGTGKTTVARYYGQILANLGLLSNGEVVVKNPSDFIGSVIGGSEKQTKAILASTIGKVLIIDEAYMLYGGKNGAGGNHTDIFRTAVIDTIVAEVQSVPGEDRCVLLLGYKDQMVEMFQNVNPGLARRFAIEDAFSFEDFSDDELLDILELKMKAQHLDATDDAKRVAIERLSRARTRPNFGNGGEVENLLGQAKTRYQARQAQLPVNERDYNVLFEPQDFDPEFDRSANASANLQKLFEDVVGCEDVVNKLGKYQETARKMKARGLDTSDQIPTSFIMKGPPGTGKTTTARKIGQVYYDMGFLSFADVIECSASDLVGQWVGHTGPKVQKQMEKALGKVLFIDEAYRLAEGTFAQEAIDELVGALTQPKYLNKIVVILAGYDQDMNRLLAVNSGLSSRFSEEIVFTNIDPVRCLEILKKGLAKKRVSLPVLGDPNSTGYQELEALIEDMQDLPSWGNARDIGTLAKQMISHVYANLPDSDADSYGTSDDSDPSRETSEISTKDAVMCLKNMLAERRARSTNVLPSSRTRRRWKDYSQMPQQTNSGNPPPVDASTTSSTGGKTQASAKPRESSEKAQVSTPASAQPPSPPRDPGISDAVWDELQQAKRAAQLEEKRILEEQRRVEREREEVRRREEAEETRLAALAAALAAKKAAEWVEAKRKLEEERLKVLAARKERERQEAERRRKMEEETRRKEQEAQVRQKLRRMGVCPVGYQWIKMQGGYRCAGGSHWVSDSQLGL